LPRGRAGSTKQIGVDLALDLRVADLFRCAEQRVAGIADHDVDPLQIGEGSVDNLAHALAVRDVEGRDPKTLAILVREVLESLGLADCGGYPVATMKQQLGQLPSEAAARTRNKPCLRHDMRFR